MKKVRWYEVLDQCKDMFQNGTLNRVFLHGPPGTGKSSWPVLSLKNTERVAITQGTTADHLLGIFTLQEGKTVWVDGPATRAVRNGTPLVLDEIDRYSDDVEALLHALLDDIDICQIQLTNGEILRPKKGYMVFGTTNGNPDQLGEALRDRFELTLHCKEPHPNALKKLPREVHATVMHQYSALPDFKVSVERFTLRQCMVFPKLSRALDNDELAAFILFGNQGKEFLSVIASNRAAAKAVRWVSMMPDGAVADGVMSEELLTPEALSPAPESPAPEQPSDASTGTIY